jgi:hypothetical protein
MMTCDLLLAALLLTAPAIPAPEATGPDGDPTKLTEALHGAGRNMGNWAEAVRAALLVAMVDAELMEAGETGAYISGSNYYYGLEHLRERWRDLEAAPAVCEAGRFPSWSVLEAWVQLNYRVREALAERQKVDAANWDELRAAIAEMSRVGAALQLAARAASPLHAAACRRRALRDLREMIGPEAFYSGRLPSPVP